jgi:hypothetical protein
MDELDRLARSSPSSHHDEAIADGMDVLLILQDRFFRDLLQLLPGQLSQALLDVGEEGVSLADLPIYLLRSLVPGAVKPKGAATVVIPAQVRVLMTAGEGKQKRNVKFGRQPVVLQVDVIVLCRRHQVAQARFQAVQSQVSEPDEITDERRPTYRIIQEGDQRILLIVALRGRIAPGSPVPDLGPEAFKADIFGRMVLYLDSEGEVMEVHLPPVPIQIDIAGNAILELTDDDKVNVFSSFSEAGEARSDENTPLLVWLEPPFEDRFEGLASLMLCRIRLPDNLDLHHSRYSLPTLAAGATRNKVHCQR